MLNATYPRQLEWCYLLVTLISVTQTKQLYRENDQRFVEIWFWQSGLKDIYSIHLCFIGIYSSVSRLQKTGSFGRNCVACGTSTQLLVIDVQPASRSNVVGAITLQMQSRSAWQMQCGRCNYVAAAIYISGTTTKFCTLNPSRFTLKQHVLRTHLQCLAQKQDQIYYIILV